MSTGGIPAGWYPDPGGQTGTQRYWDGKGWTHQTRPDSPTPTPTPTPTSIPTQAPAQAAAGPSGPPHEPVWRQVPPQAPPGGPQAWGAQAPGAGAPPVYGQPTYGSPYGYGQGGYGQGGYGQGGYGRAGHPATGGTDAFAIVSLVCGIVGIPTFGIVAPFAVVFGHLARSRIRATNQGGRGLTVAGLILGYIGCGILVLLIIGLAVGNGTHSNNHGSLGPALLPGRSG